MLGNVLNDVFAKEWFIKVNNKGYTVHFEERDSQILMITNEDKIITFADKNKFHINSMKDNIVVLKSVKTDLVSTFKVTWELHRNEEFYNEYKKNNSLVNRVINRGASK